VLSAFCFSDSRALGRGINPCLVTNSFWWLCLVACIASFRRLGVSNAAFFLLFVQGVALFFVTTTFKHLVLASYFFFLSTAYIFLSIYSLHLTLRRY